MSAKIRTRARKGLNTPLRTLSRTLPTQLLRARETVMHCFRPHLNKLGFTDQQGRIIRTLAEVEWIDMLELSQRCCIHPASLSRIVPRLHEKGILRRRQDRNDARRVMVSLTRKGRSVYATLSSESEKIYEDIAAQLGAARLHDLHRCLDALIESLGGSDAAITAEAEAEG